MAYLSCNTAYIIRLKGLLVNKKRNVKSTESVSSGLELLFPVVNDTNRYYNELKIVP